MGQLPVLPKHFWEGKKFDEPSLDEPLGQRALQAEELRSRPLGDHGARSRITGARICRSTSAPTITTSCARITTAIPPWCWRPSRPAASISAPRTPPRPGRPAMSRRRLKDGRFKMERHRERQPAGHAGLHHESAPPDVPGSAGAPGDDPRLRFRMVEQDAVLRPVQAHAQLFPEFRDGSEGPALAGGTEDPGALRGKIPDEVFTTEYNPPVTRRQRHQCRESGQGGAAPRPSRLEAGGRQAREGRQAVRDSSSCCRPAIRSTASCSLHAKSLERLGVKG